MQKRQRLSLVLRQAVQRVRLLLCFFGPRRPVAAGASRCSSSAPACRITASVPRSPGVARSTALSGGVLAVSAARLLSSSICFICPAHARPICSWTNTLAQVMGVAQSMGTIILPIRTEAIVDGPSLERWQDTDRACRLRATLFMIGVVRQLRGTGRVQPPRWAATYIPVSSKCATSAWLRPCLMCVSVSSRAAAHPASAACKVPSETGWPNRSATI